MNTSLPTPIPFTGEGVTTSMFYSTMIQLGPDGICGIPNPESRRPYFGFSRVARGQTTGTHLHDCYSLLMFSEGEYEISGKTYGPGTVMLIEPRVPTGECVPGPNGVMELFFYDSGYGAIPFFKDITDPRTTALFETCPAIKDFSLCRPRPPEDPVAKVHVLDRIKHARKYGALTVYPCQVGPAGFGASPQPDGKRPFVLLVQFAPHAAVPRHSHDGWNSIAVITGSLAVSGAQLTAETSLLLEPGAVVSYEAGSSGALACLFFDAEHAAIPHFESPADAAAFPII
jgi:quercetin dioxygenase-like cupin family protein